MKAFVINLDRSVDRLAHMRAEFGRIGVPFTRVPGVDGSAMSAAELKRFAERRTAVLPGKWLPGEVGCFRGHFSVWERIASGPDAYAAVFEDDLHFAADLATLLGSSEWIPADADIVRLEANRKMLLRRGRRASVCPRRWIYRVASRGIGACGYILSRKAAQRIVASPQEHHLWADIFLFHPGRSPVAAQMRIYQIVPAVCVEAQIFNPANPKFQSTIGSEGRAPTITPPSFWEPLRWWLPWKKQLIRFSP